MVSWKVLEKVGSSWKQLDIHSGDRIRSKLSENPLLKAIDRRYAYITRRASSACFSEAECNR